MACLELVENVGRVEKIVMREVRGICEENLFVHNAIFCKFLLFFFSNQTREKLPFLSLLFSTFPQVPYKSMLGRCPMISSFLSSEISTFILPCVCLSPKNLCVFFGIVQAAYKINGHIVSASAIEQAIFCFHAPRVGRVLLCSPL